MRIWQSISLCLLIKVNEQKSSIDLLLGYEINCFIMLDMDNLDDDFKIDCYDNVRIWIQQNGTVYWDFFFQVNYILGQFRYKSHQIFFLNFVKFRHITTHITTSIYIISERDISDIGLFHYVTLHSWLRWIACVFCSYNFLYRQVTSQDFHVLLL